MRKANTLFIVLIKREMMMEEYEFYFVEKIYHRILVIADSGEEATKIAKEIEEDTEEALSKESIFDYERELIS